MAAEVEEQEVPDVSQAADESRKEHRRNRSTPDGDSADERDQADPQQVEAVLVDHGTDGVGVVHLERRRFHGIGDALHGFRRVLTHRHDASKHVDEAPDHPQRRRNSQEPGCSWCCSNGLHADVLLGLNEQPSWLLIG